MWGPAEVGAVDLAISGRRLTAHITDSEGRRGPRREREAMDEQSVEVRGVAEGGGWAPRHQGTFSIRGAMLSPSLWEAASAGRRGRLALCFCCPRGALGVPGAEAVPQSGAGSLQRCLGTSAGPCLHVELFQSKSANSSEGLALLSRHDLLGIIKHFFSSSDVHFVIHTAFSYSTVLKTGFQP